MRIIGLLVLVALSPAVAYASLVNINTASATLLDTLPGIGPVKATAIIEYRAEHGLFKAIEDIQNVKGIGPVTFVNIKALITVGAAGEAQPPAPITSFHSVQTVEPAQSSNTSGTAHEHSTVGAPAATTSSVVAAGATLPPATSDTPVTSSTNVLHSPWTLTFIGIVAIAGGIFIFL